MKREPPLTQEELRAVRLMIKVGGYDRLEIDRTYKPPRGGVPMVKVRTKAKAKERRL